jgi:hypothetical protein
MARVLLPARAERPEPALPDTGGMLHAPQRDRNLAGVSVEPAQGFCPGNTCFHPMGSSKLCWDLPVNQGMDIVFCSYHGQLLALSFHQNSGGYTSAGHWKSGRGYFRLLREKIAAGRP